MAGREKKQIYVYSLKDGSFVESFETQTECLKKHFPKDISKRPLLIHSFRIATSKNKEKQTIKFGINENFMFFEERIYRDDVVFLFRIYNSEYCKKEKESKEIEVFNLLGEKIAEFKNLRLLTKLMPFVNASKLTRKLNGISKNVNRHNRLGLFFKYKQ